MIGFDFAYYKPKTLAEAVSLHRRLQTEGARPLYFSGGTEILTMARTNDIFTDAVIDIKGIPECRALGLHGEWAVFGAALAINKVKESGLYPLLGETAGRVADHTSRNKITLGGNLCSRIMYREAVLPLLLADAQVVLAGVNGVRSVPIAEVFQGEMRLGADELLVQVRVERRYTTQPYVHVKYTRVEEIDYPLVTLSALRIDGQIRAAFSGLVAYPFRSLEMEQVLNDRGVSREARATEAMRHIPAPILDDMRGSADYRAYVWQNLVSDMLETLEGVGDTWPAV